MSRDTPDDDLDIEWKIFDALVGFDPINPDPVAGYMVIEICNELIFLLRDNMSKDEYEHYQRIFVKPGEYLIGPATKWKKINRYLIKFFREIFPTLHSFQNFIKTNYLGTTVEFNSTALYSRYSNQRIEALWRLITQTQDIYDLPIDAHLNPYMVT